MSMLRKLSALFRGTAQIVARNRLFRIRRRSGFKVLASVRSHDALGRVDARFSKARATRGAIAQQPDCIVISANGVFSPPYA